MADPVNYFTGQQCIRIMTKDQLAIEITKRTGLDKLQVSKVVESFMEVIKNNMVQNKNIYLRGFGTFEVKKRQQKTARNITKGTQIIIPEHFVPHFKPSKEFLSLVRDRKV
jgi:DNA-binding protein HU-beta